MTGAVARGGGGGLVLEPSGDRLDVQRVFAVPRIVGPALDGLAADEEGFIVAGDDGRVEGTERTWAAGDGIVSPIKFGGLATHQARVVAAGIARVAGVDDVPDPGEPVLHGRLLVGHRTRRLRGRGDAEGAPLWWPQGKIAGEYLPRWLSEHGVAPPGGVPAPEGRRASPSSARCARYVPRSTSTCSSSAASTGSPTRTWHRSAGGCAKLAQNDRDGHAA